MIKAVLFDLDGTLCNTLADLADAANFALAQHGFAPQPTESYKRFAGGGVGTMLRLAIGQPVDDAKLAVVLADYLARYSGHFADKTTCYDGLPELIAVLKSQSYRLAVVTNKPQATAQLVIDQLYPGRFDLIIGQREGLSLKPDPAAAKLAMDTLGVRPCECVFIGDSGVDMQTAIASGALPVGVLWGFRSRDELLQTGAMHLLDAPDELFALLRLKLEK